MIVECLHIKIAPSYREVFVQKDDEIWTSFLRQCPGFLRKEVWISTNDLSEVRLSIYWATLEQQQAISQSQLDAIQSEFVTALDVPYQLLEIQLYQMRKSTLRSA
ncbi:MAG TPA: TIGR03792 family protein [Stenomitos sp.]